MILTVHGMNIECPDHSGIVGLVKDMGLSEIRTLSQYQKQAKNWPGQTDIPEYCLYLGSMEDESGKYDLYHYESGSSYPHYSTAIVYGNEGGDYMSGWSELSAKEDRGHYKELMKREYRCGLLTADDLVRIGVAVLCGSHSENDVIRPMRDNFKLRRVDTFERECSEPTFDFYYEVAI